MTTRQLPPIDPAQLAAVLQADPDAGFGALRADGGNLPLEALSVDARLVGLTSQVLLTQRFRNPHRHPVEAVYVFPLPDRGAVTAMRMTAADRTVVAQLRERAAARAEYETAIAAGKRAALAEEDRPDVFTMRVGNILANESVTVELTVVGVLPVADGEATFRFPLVVAPRYVPGAALPADSVGDGQVPDTDAVPDASRITPPVLLPGFPDPVRLEVQIDLDPAGLPMGVPRSSLHAVQVDGGRIRIEPGARADRDVVLRIPIETADAPAVAFGLVPDPGETGVGTFELTVLPPALQGPGRPRDVVLLLDRSGSMSGWKMIAARRAAARIVDTLGERDRFAVLAFDDRIDGPGTVHDGLIAGTDRHRFRAVEFLAGVSARGGTDLAEPLERALALLAGSQPDRERVLVLVTDGQVGNEDQLLRAHARAIGAVRLHAVGIDRAVNAGFLGRLASLGGGRCELIESEDRLDEAMDTIHRRIGSPLVTGLSLEPAGVELVPGSVTPARLPDVFAGVPYVVRGRYREDGGRSGLTLRGTAPDGTAWSVTAAGRPVQAPAVTAAWARACLRDLEDRYLAQADAFGGLEEPADLSGLEHRIVATSLDFGVLCRFTAYVAVDERVVTDGSAPRTVVQPVEQVSGWQPVSPVAFGPSAGAPAAPAPRTMRARAFGSAAPAGVVPMALPAPGVAGSRLMRAHAAPATLTAGSSSGPGQAEPDDASFLRSLLAIEAERLRDLTPAPEHRRREALLDLASRVLALATELPADGGPAGAGWHALLDLLRSDRPAGGPIDQVWAEVLSALDAVAAGSRPGAGTGSSESDAADAGAGQPEPRRSPGRMRPAFWKHFPDR